MYRIILFLLISFGILFSQNVKRRYDSLRVDSGFKLGTTDLTENQLKELIGDSTLTGLDSVGTYQGLKNLKVYNVLDYGAAGDGITNDYAAFAEIIDSIAAGSIDSAVIFIPTSRIFYVPDTVKLASTKIKIEGGGSITTDQGNPIFYQTDRTKLVEINNITFLGDGTGFEFAGTGNPGTMYFHYRIQDCNFIGNSVYATNYAIKLVNAREGKIINSYFENNAGIYRRRTVNTEIIGCDWKNTAYALHDDGDGSAYSAGARVIAGTAIGVDSAFVFKSGDYFELNGVMADYCNTPVHIVDMDGGIISGGYYSSRQNPHASPAIPSSPTIKITKNSTYSQHIKIIGATILAHDVQASGATAIEIDNAAHTHISYSTIHFWTKYGVYDSLSTFTSISYCRFAPRPTYGESGGGIYSVSDNSVNKFMENTFNSGFGITKTNAQQYNNINAGGTSSSAYVEVDSSSYSSPGYVFYGGDGELIEQWGSTGYVKPSSEPLIEFPKKFLTACYGVQLTPLRGTNPDSTGYKWHVKTVSDSGFIMQFFGTDSSIYFYRAIGN